MKKRLFFVLILVIATSAAVVLQSKTSVHAEETRIVMLHVDGKERAIASNGATVKQVLQRTDVVLGEHDKTEPSLDEPIVGNEFTINIYRARPITVIDGANNYTILTAERSPRAIATDAGFQTKAEDQFGFQRSDDPYEAAPGTQMVIKRAKTINFDLYGTASALSTNENTVADLLKARKITLDPKDEVNVPLQARIVEGMTVSIARIGKDVQTVEEPAPFPEEQIKDAQQPVGYKQIQTPGKNGKKLVTYELISRNGGAPVKTAIKEVITEQPVKQVVIVGAKAFNGNVSGEKQSLMAQAGIAESDYQYVDYIIGRESGWRVNATNGRTWGLCQALPGSKMSSAGADWQTNPVTQLKWCSGYARGRYGSWAGAYAAWIRQHWW